MLQFLIPAIGSLIGGMLNNKTQTDVNNQNVAFQHQTNLQNMQFQQQTNQTMADLDNSKIQRLVYDATAAGINPLAALGSPISTPSAMQVTPSFSSPRVEGSTATGDAVGDAFHSIGGVFGLRRQQLENELLEAQIEGTRAQVAEARSRSVIRAARAVSTGGPGQTLDEFVIDPQRTTHVRGPGDWFRIPSRGGSDAQSWEDRYGDVIENAAGIGNLIWDIGAMLPTRSAEGWRGF